MLSPTGWWLAVGPIDLLCGVDGLIVMAGEVLAHAPAAGGACVFRNRAGTQIKVLCVDAHGVWLRVRRLHENRFHWPRLGKATCALSIEQLQWLHRRGLAATVDAPGGAWRTRVS